MLFGAKWKSEIIFNSKFIEKYKKIVKKKGIPFAHNPMGSGQFNLVKGVSPDIKQLWHYWIVLPKMMEKIKDDSEIT